MKNCSYSSKKITKVAVKGTLSDDCSTINYETADKGVFADLSIERCLEMFAGKDISFSVSLTEDEDLSNELSN